MIRYADASLLPISPVRSISLADLVDSVTLGSMYDTVFSIEIDEHTEIHFFSDTVLY